MSFYLHFLLTLLFLTPPTPTTQLAPEELVHRIVSGEHRPHAFILFLPVTLVLYL